MTRQIIATPDAPAAIGPYSQAVSTGALVFTAGQLGLNPATGKLAEGVEAQASQAMANLAAILAAAGSSLDRVVKTTIFLQNLSDFAAVNAIYGAAFSATPPARSTVQVAALPLGGLVEIEAIALVGE
ncbi:MAG: RidA family protein [Anaerolinea sp.]|nr:RidA family protein [Anaerolinea sp.]